MIDKTCVCFLTSTYIKTDSIPSQRYAQYDNIINIIKTINFDKYDVL